MAADATPETKASGNLLVAQNRVGKTVEGIGATLEVIVSGNNSYLKFLNEQKKQKKKKLRRQRDQASELKQEGKKPGEDLKPTSADPKPTDDDEEEIEEIENPFMAWLNKTIAPLANFLKEIITLVIAQDVLQWMSDPANSEKLKSTVEKAGVVFGTLAKWMGGFANNVLEGLTTLMDPEATFWQRIKGFGELLVGLAGIKYLLNPFSLIGDIVWLAGLLGDINPFKGPDGDEVKTKTKKKGGGVDADGNFKQVKKKQIIDPDGTIRTKTDFEIKLKDLGLDDDQIRAFRKAKQSGANTKDALTAARKIKGVKPKSGWWNKITTAAGDLIDDVGDWAVKGFNDNMKKLANFGQSLRNSYDNATKGAMDWFGKQAKNVQDGVSKKIMAPLMEFLEPALKPILALKDSLMKNLMKIPGLEKLLKKIGLQSLDGAASIAKKMGAKALPWVGGLINVLFAYDRFASGDLVGGIIESVSGALDIAGMWPGSLALDAYMFGRDMFPETVMGAEEGLIDLIPGATAAKGKIESVISKLPDLGQIISMLTGGEKGEKGQLERQDDLKNLELKSMGGLIGSDSNYGQPSPSFLNPTSVGGVSPASPFKRVDKKTIPSFSAEFAMMSNEVESVAVPIPIAFAEAVPVAMPINTSAEVIVARTSPLLSK